ncbi:MAG: outer membrane lipoprotein-sorting protein [Gammaproteobacteria bacterium]|jgi:hypothetical protein|nr:outer membrane lipoprotein-sorting protein [Gammaproteobacteria bacterium]
MKKILIGAAAAAFSFSSVTAMAGVSKELPMASGSPSADEIIEQVYFVNHFYALKNFGIKKKGKNITVIISRTEGKKPSTLTVERYLNNDYSDGKINTKDVAIFRSGKLKGTGMLITDYVDDAKSQSYAIWLPALRKIRRFAEPAHDDAWGGTDFTFGDVMLRKPQHESHKLLGTETFSGCLGGMDVPKNQRNKYMKKLPEGSCVSKDKTTYKVESTPKKENWWYDNRVSYVDTQTFADYRTDYFKGGEKIKTIDRAWNSFKLDDPRAQYWSYWYGKNHKTNHETWAVIPDKVVTKNDKKLKASLWTEKTLRKIKR